MTNKEVADKIISMYSSQSFSEFDRNIDTFLDKIKMDWLSPSTELIKVLNLNIDKNREYIMTLIDEINYCTNELNDSKQTY